MDVAVVVDESARRCRALLVCTEVGIRARVAQHVVDWRRIWIRSTDGRAPRGDGTVCLDKLHKHLPNGRAAVRKAVSGPDRCHERRLVRGEHWITDHRVGIVAERARHVACRDHSSTVPVEVRVENEIDSASVVTGREGVAVAWSVGSHRAGWIGPDVVGERDVLVGWVVPFRLHAEGVCF